MRGFQTPDESPILGIKKRATTGKTPDESPILGIKKQATTGKTPDESPILGIKKQATTGKTPDESPILGIKKRATTGKTPDESPILGIKKRATTGKTPDESGNYELRDKEKIMHSSFRNTRLKRGFQLLPFILLLVVSSVFAQLPYEDLVPRHPQEMDGRVNMAKGRFSFAATDLVVPGRGLSLDFTRYYHGTAVSEYRSYLGQGWSHTYQWQLDYENRYDGHYWSIITSSGAQQTFKETPSTEDEETSNGGDGETSNGEDEEDSNEDDKAIPDTDATLTPEPGVRAALEFTSAEEFIYTTKSGIKYKPLVLV